MIAGRAIYKASRSVTFADEVVAQTLVCLSGEIRTSRSARRVVGDDRVAKAIDAIAGLAQSTACSGCRVPDDRGVDEIHSSAIGTDRSAGRHCRVPGQRRIHDLNDSTADSGIEGVNRTALIARRVSIEQAVFNSQHRSRHDAAANDE